MHAVRAVAVPCCRGGRLPLCCLCAHSPLAVGSINKFAPTAEKPFVLGLPTGSSPLLTYKRVRPRRW